MGGAKFFAALTATLFYHATACAQPGTPLIGTASVTGPTSVAVSWTPTEPWGARGYLVYERKLGLVASVLSPAFSATAAALEPETEYRFRVRAYVEGPNGFVYSDFSDWTDPVTTDTSRVPIPAQISPADGAVVPPDSVILICGRAAHGYGYRFQIVAPSGATLIDWQGLDTAQNASGRISPGRYAWRVRAYDTSDVPSRWSAAREFEVRGASGVGEERASTRFSAGVYPNPANPAATVEFITPTAGEVSVRVYDALGRDTAALFEGTLPAGTHAVRFDGSALASGAYWCVVEAGNTRAILRIALVK